MAAIIHGGGFPSGKEFEPAIPGCGQPRLGSGQVTACTLEMMIWSAAMPDQYARSSRFSSARLQVVLLSYAREAVRGIA